MASFDFSLPFELCPFSLVLNQKHFFFVKQYGISQLSKLEDSINERWARRKSESINISKYAVMRFQEKKCILL